ncbi:MAG: HPr(Ser) kinase/phosphatase [Deltaproteobacteria bacterium]
MPVSVERFQNACTVPLRMRLLAGGGGRTRKIFGQRVQKAVLEPSGETSSVQPGLVQILDGSEIHPFVQLPPERQEEIAVRYCSGPMACVVVSGGGPVPAPLAEAADRYGLPLFASELPVADLIRDAVRHLAELFGESDTIHGVLVEVLGVGVLLMGNSGVGKSECALDLILRGHRLVSDDIVHLEKRGPETVLGSGDELTRHHMEIRGLGILNIRDLFGLMATLERKKLELVIRIEEWDSEKEYDRLGVDDSRIEILGVSLPALLIPVSPGRNLATIVEVAVRNHLLKGQGVFSARTLVERQGERAGGGGPET